MNRTREELIAALKKDGLTIREQASLGSGDAKKVMRHYQLWYDKPSDKAAMVMCEGAYDRWLRKQGRANEIV